MLHRSVRHLFSMAASTHIKSRTLEYSGGPKRFPVPDDKVSWKVGFPAYKPVDYTAKVVLSGPVWADPDFRKATPSCSPCYNKVDGKVDRTSFTGVYDVIGGVPRNPVGRTGMCGRGLLGRWGPNHAADPIVTRWKRDCKGDIVMVEGKPRLEFVAIKRKDTGDWAIPGGMVEAGDTVSVTLKKEFGEEAMNSLEASEAEKKEIEAHINALFSKGEEIYAGYVDDPRNTDNSWMETVAQNFHDEAGDAVSRVALKAGDDAGDVRWLEASSRIKLYASHLDFVREVVRRRKASWDA